MYNEFVLTCDFYYHRENIRKLSTNNRNQFTRLLRKWSMHQLNLLCNNRLRCQKYFKLLSYPINVGYLLKSLILLSTLYLVMIKVYNTIRSLIYLFRQDIALCDFSPILFCSLKCNVYV